MDISVKTTDYATGDHRWLGSSHGTDQGETITLDTSAFVAAHYAEGFIPSGTVLAKITATGLYGPYDGAGAGGLEVAIGHLLTDTPCDGVADLGASLFTHGRVDESFLPAFTGTTDGEIDAGAKTDIGTRIRYV